MALERDQLSVLRDDPVASRVERVGGTYDRCLLPNSARERAKSSLALEIEGALAQHARGQHQVERVRGDRRRRAAPGRAASVRRLSLRTCVMRGNSLAVASPVESIARPLMISCD